MTIPKHLQVIDKLYGIDALKSAVGFFSRHGVSLAYVPRKGWRFYCIGRSDGPTYVVCWVCVASLIEMLDEPSKTLAAIREQGGDVR
jgi:hypothetical protein